MHCSRCALLMPRRKKHNISQFTGCSNFNVCVVCFIQGQAIDLYVSCDPPSQSKKIFSGFVLQTVGFHLSQCIWVFCPGCWAWHSLLNWMRFPSAWSPRPHWTISGIFQDRVFHSVSVTAFIFERSEVLLVANNFIKCVSKQNSLARICCFILIVLLP